MSPFDQGSMQACWGAQIGLISQLLVIWFLLALAHSFWFVDFLETTPSYVYSVKHWLAQHGLLCVSGVEILYYLWRVRQLDRRHGF